MTNEQYLSRRSTALGQGDVAEVRRLDAEAGAAGLPATIKPQPIVAPNVPEPRPVVPTGGPVVSHQGTASTVGHAPEGVVGPVAPGVSRAHVPMTPVTPGYPKSTPDGVVLDWGPNGPPTEVRVPTPTPVPVTPVPDTRIPNPVPPVRDSRVPTPGDPYPTKPFPKP